VVVRNAAELAAEYTQYEVGYAHAAVLHHVPDLRLPMLQRYYELGTVDVVSLSGCLDRDGSVLALSHSRKISQAPRRFGVGTMFEPLPEQPFTERAVDAVRSILGSGLFELEVLVDNSTGEYWAIDLNPRGFGQMTLDMALGNDLPRLWYQSVTGAQLPVAPSRDRRPELWHNAVTSYVEFGVRFVQGPERAQMAGQAFRRMTASKVEAAFEWRDPLPGMIFGLKHFRHPRAFLRPFLVDTEVAESSDGHRPKAPAGTPAR
jgi:predicted ATP-grasp superfamily ATP-dependent carboligase